MSGREPPKEHPEFSDFGRSPRFPPGWWMVLILAALVIAAMVFGGFIWG